jgi:hypothetical protein
MEVFIFLLFALVLLVIAIYGAGDMIGNGIDNDVMQNVIAGIFLAVPSVILFIVCIVYIVTHYIFK